MADYNSSYTGTEVDAAVAKTGTILESKQVYTGSPTNSGVPMSSISTNPDTGNKTGTYDVIYSTTNTSVDGSTGEPNVSRIWIGDEAQTSAGTGHADMSDTTIYSSSADYNGSNFTAILSSHTFSSGTATNANIYIHKIFRLQRIS